MPQCSVCLKETNTIEFLENGGLCKPCHKQVYKIYLKGGNFDDVSKFWMKKRAEYVKEHDIT